MAFIVSKTSRTLAGTLSDFSLPFFCRLAASSLGRSGDGKGGIKG